MKILLLIFSAWPGLMKPFWKEINFINDVLGRDCVEILRKMQIKAAESKEEHHHLNPIRNKVILLHYKIKQDMNNSNKYLEDVF
ncbi:unnamed protein product [Blepharisma stoltei]|uniref:Uncharacterized protein n=1 Tax=Blepharisma stoltei TaxID=1481888 RepID=A0AAU9JKX9_9CILI|nr:unnamed protein product [Blepharisma stoltei]